jgi:hypothetical protein
MIVDGPEPTRGCCPRGPAACDTRWPTRPYGPRPSRPGPVPKRPGRCGHPAWRGHAPTAWSPRPGHSRWHGRRSFAGSSSVARLAVKAWARHEGGTRQGGGRCGSPRKLGIDEVATTTDAGVSSSVSSSGGQRWSGRDPISTGESKGVGECPRKWWRTLGGGSE